MQTALHRSAAGTARLLGRGRPGRWLCSAAAPPRYTKLVLYSKEGCHLCDGLKDKVSAVLERARFQQSALTDVSLEVRDILSREEWERAHGLFIPVLTKVTADGASEVKIPRFPPRTSTDRVAARLEQELGAPPPGA